MEMQESMSWMSLQTLQIRLQRQDEILIRCGLYWLMKPSQPQKTLLTTGSSCFSRCNASVAITINMFIFSAHAEVLKQPPPAPHCPPAPPTTDWKLSFFCNSPSLCRRAWWQIKVSAFFTRCVCGIVLGFTPRKSVLICTPPPNVLSANTAYFPVEDRVPSRLLV